MRYTNIPIDIEYHGQHFNGEADPTERSVQPTSFLIILNGTYFGTLSIVDGESWSLNRPAEPELVETLGNYITAWYENTFNQKAF